jgi:hypothetical protein
VNSICSSCSDTEDTYSCPEGEFCSTGSDGQVDVYTTGTCYETECIDDNTDCTSLIETCDSSTGLCVDITCTDYEDCPDTGVCEDSACVFCSNDDTN